CILPGPGIARKHSTKPGSVILRDCDEQAGPWLHGYALPDSQTADLAPPTMAIAGTPPLADRASTAAQSADPGELGRRDASTTHTPTLIREAWKVCSAPQKAGYEEAAGYGINSSVALGHMRYDECERRDTEPLDELRVLSVELTCPVNNGDASVLAVTCLPLS